MRLDQALVARNLCESRTEAQELIKDGAVIVNGIVCTKQIKEVYEEDVCVVTKRRTFVSRGGEKLQGALLDIYGGEDEIRKHLTGVSALDVGSSTGGFTNCLLSYGVEHVDAVDVGTNQLHAKLRADARVSLYEQTDIRSFERQYEYGMIVADLSFISLRDVLGILVSLGTQRMTEYILLIKPQFEVGKGNTKKGIVKNQDLVDEILREYREKCEAQGMKDVRVYPCHIRGGDGNQEYIIYGSLH